MYLHGVISLLPPIGFLVTNLAQHCTLRVDILVEASFMMVNPIDVRNFGVTSYLFKSGTYTVKQVE